ncbi:hypothetical protein C5Y97_23110 [Blastopirellula marina]|uniref:Uncharacterized protein n=1 Tax=Blastopirellula marina TaxID=124 RepID=A0A2S8F957_9BACT|nr:hypothetical protein C5Y98_23100 [Blastopirellula marina]PTL41948.1 hypothetical protein C5Y97_23110 [Blastopirellula marina]
MSSTTESYDETILANLDGAISRSAADGILALGFSPQQRERMHELAAKARAGELSESEREETQSFERVSCLLGILQSKARISLKQTTS